MRCWLLLVDWECRGTVDGGGCTLWWEVEWDTGIYPVPEPEPDAEAEAEVEVEAMM